MISSIVTKVTTVNGTKKKKETRPPASNIDQAKPAIIFNKQWPAIIFANNRIDKLKTRAI